MKNEKNTIITLVIGEKTEKIEVFDSSNLKEIAISIVKKHFLAKEAIEFIEENIRKQLKKIEEKTNNSHNSSEKNSNSCLESTKDKSFIKEGNFLKKKPEKNEFHDKLYKKGMDFLKKKQEKNEIFRMKFEENQMKEATFRPKISENHRNKSFLSKKRDISEDLYQNGLKIMENREKSCEIIKKQEIQKKCPFKPEICEESFKILMKKQHLKEDLTNRLYKIKEKNTSIEKNSKKLNKSSINLTKSSLNLEKNSKISKNLKENSKNSKNLEKSYKKQENNLKKLDKSPTKSDKKSPKSVKMKEEFDFHPKISKDSYHYNAKQKENEEITRFRKRLISKENSKKTDENPKKPPNFFEKQARTIFELLDSSKKGRISAENVDLSQIHPFLLEIIQMVLFEMEEKRTFLDFYGFLAGLKRFGLEKPVKNYFKKNMEKIECFHNPQFSFGDYSENLKFLREEGAKRKKIDVEERKNEIFTRRYNNVIKTSFEI